MSTPETRRIILQAAINTIDQQIKSLKNFVPAIQLKIWRERRAKLNKQLKSIPK